jgi:hypothetical protein
MIQVVYDKLVNFCGVTKIPCVIVGSKSDLSISYVSFLFLPIKKKNMLSVIFSSRCFSLYLCFFSFFNSLPILAVKLIRLMEKSWPK